MRWNTVHTTCDAGCVRPTPAAARRGAPASSVSLDFLAYAPPATAGLQIESIFSVFSAKLLLVARRARLTQFASAIREAWSAVALGLGAPPRLAECLAQSVSWCPVLASFC